MSAGDILESANKSTELARSLLSNGTAARVAGRSGGPGGGNGAGAASMGGSGAVPKTGGDSGSGDGKAGAKGVGDTEGGKYGSGGRPDKGGGDLAGGGSSGGRGGGAGGTGVSEVAFGALTEGLGASSAALGAETIWAKSSREGFDPDNSDTWTAEEKARLLKEALEMDPDAYFRLIPVNESLFQRVHRRYRKIDHRWAPLIAK